MAIRLGMAFGGGPKTWLQLPAAHELTQAKKQRRLG